LNPSPKTRASARKKVDDLKATLSKMLDFAEDVFDFLKVLKIQRPFRRSNLTRLRREFLLLQQDALASDNPKPDIGAAKKTARAINQLYTQLMDALEADVQGYPDKMIKDGLKPVKGMRRLFASVARKAIA
jgi:hypothetical protein